MKICIKFLIKGCNTFGLGHYHDCSCQRGSVLERRTVCAVICFAKSAQHLFRVDTTNKSSEARASCHSFSQVLVLPCFCSCPLVLIWMDNVSAVCFNSDNAFFDYLLQTLDTHLPGTFPLPASHRFSLFFFIFAQMTLSDVNMCPLITFLSLCTYSGVPLSEARWKGVLISWGSFTVYKLHHSSVYPDVWEGHARAWESNTNWQRNRGP